MSNPLANESRMETLKKSFKGIRGVKEEEKNAALAWAHRMVDGLQ